MQDTVHNNMAKFAYEKVSDAGKNNKEFRSLARSFPSTIQVNGLGAAVAFLLSKKSSDAHKKMYELLDVWTKNKFCLKSEEALMERIVHMESGAYRIYTDEIMNLCLWIKRFAEGMIDSGLEDKKKNAG